MARPRACTGALAAALALVSSGCLLPPLPNDVAEGPRASVLVHAVTVNLSVTLNNSSGTQLGVDTIQLPHCSFAFFGDNGTTLRLFGAEPDPNITAVVLVAYPQGTSFSGGGDDTRVFLLRAGEKASVPAALNRTSPIYAYDPGADLPFGPADGSAPRRDAFDLSYAVRGNLTLYPDFYPPVDGTFDVDEHHILASRGVAALEWGGPGICM